VKKILFIAFCAALLASCASPRAGMVDPAIAEAKVLQTLTRERDADVSVSTSDLVAKAEAQKEKGQTEDAYLLADEAILLFQIALLEKEKRNIEDSLAMVNEILKVDRGILEDRKGTTK